MRSSRRDPYWDVDGDAVRRQRRRSSLVAVIAFFVSFVALAGAAVAWAATVGPAPAGLAGIGDYASAAGDMVRRGGLAVGTIGSILVLSTVLAGIAMVAPMLPGPTGERARARPRSCAPAETEPAPGGPAFVGVRTGWTDRRAGRGSDGASHP